MKAQSFDSVEIKIENAQKLILTAKDSEIYQQILETINYKIINVLKKKNSLKR